MTYTSFTPREVADILGFYDDEEITGEQIAKDLLLGTVPFTKREFEKLARKKEMTVGELIKADKRLRVYKNPYGFE